jgi:hypothetical protein
LWRAITFAVYEGTVKALRAAELGGISEAAE